MKLIVLQLTSLMFLVLLGEIKAHPTPFLDKLFGGYDRSYNYGGGGYYSYTNRPR